MTISWPKLLNNFYLNRHKAKETIINLLSLSLVKIYLLTILAINAIDWLIVYFINKNLSQSLVILHYNVNLGVNLIGEAVKIYTIPLLGLIFALLNFVLLLYIYRQGKFVIHLLMSSAILANLFLLAATGAIYLINSR